MFCKNLTLTQTDREIWENELDAFVPGRIFDVHTHLWNESYRGTSKASPLRIDVDNHALRKSSAVLFPGRDVHFLILGSPLPGMDVEGHNTWIGGQAAGDKKSRASMLITPDMKPEAVAASVRRHKFCGFKVYRTFAPDQTNAGIRDFLPEALIEVADQFKLTITLHMSRKAGPADPGNLADLKYFTSRYPRVQWILAHLARGFHPALLEKALPVLRDLPNIWSDTSAVNDLYSHILILKHEDLKRILFGTDNIVAGCARGKYITYGYAWEFYGGQQHLEHCNPEPTFVVYEQLRQQRQAADVLGLTSDEIEDIFWRNAERLIGSKK